MNKYLYILILCISIFACGDKKKLSKLTVSDIPIVKVADCEKVENISKSYPEYFLETKYVKLESTDESILGEITQMEIFENHIYILDKKGKSLKKFDMNGKYIQNIGRTGMGSGEYIALNAFYINPERKTINIFDPMKNAVLQYDLSGKYQNTVQVEKNSTTFVCRLSYLNEDEIFCFSGTNWQTNCEFSILDEKKQYKETCLYPYPIKSNQRMSFALFSRPYDVRNNEVSYVLMFCDTVFSYSNNEIRPRMIIESGKPPADLQTLRTIFSEKNESMLPTISDVGKKGYTLGLKNIFETESFICYDFFSIAELGYLVFDAILWNKKNNTGVYLSHFLSPAPTFGAIYCAFDNTFVRVWKEDQITNFKDILEQGIFKREDYDEEIMKLVDSYNVEEDNPILIFYTMK
jgi:hypothetical protein